jgi:hypothetical protein
MLQRRVLSTTDLRVFHQIVTSREASVSSTGVSGIRLLLAITDLDRRP